MDLCSFIDTLQHQYLEKKLLSQKRKRRINLIINESEYSKKNFSTSRLSLLFGQPFTTTRPDEGDFDTSVIIKKEIYYPEYNPVEVHGKYLPQTGVVWYKNKNLQYHPDGYRLIDITKEHPRKKTSLSINYLYSDVLILNLVSGSIYKYKQGKVYEFNTYHPNGRWEQPEKIFWHEDYGIIKYITHGDVMWERINLPQ